MVLDGSTREHRRHSAGQAGRKVRPQPSLI
jgi:hypothetical protein